MPHPWEKNKGNNIDVVQNVSLQLPSPFDPLRTSCSSPLKWGQCNHRDMANQKELSCTLPSSRGSPRRGRGSISGTSGA